MTAIGCSEEKAKERLPEGDTKEAPAVDTARPSEPESPPSQDLTDVEPRPEQSIEATSAATIPPKTMIVSYPLRGNATKGVMEKIFTHERHAKEYGTTCDACHHVYEDGKNVWKAGMRVKKCARCHDDPALQGREELVAGFQLKNMVTHPSCKDCHRSGYLKRLIQE
jgi:hypothetical protein